MLHESSTLCSSCNMGTSDFPEIRIRTSTRAHRAQVQVPEIYALTLAPQVHMLQLIYSTWVTYLQVWETIGMLRKCTYMGPCVLIVDNIVRAMTRRC